MPDKVKEAAEKFENRLSRTAQDEEKETHREQSKATTAGTEVSAKTEKEIAADLGPGEILLEVPPERPGSYVPTSGPKLPNTENDALKIAREKSPDAILAMGPPEASESEGVRVDANATGLRDARDLAALIRAHPTVVNELSKLDEFEKARGVKEPVGWVKNPVDLYEEAKRYNVSFIGNNGNIVANSY